MGANLATLQVLFEQNKNNFNPIRLILACAVIYGHAFAVVREGGADFVTRYFGFGFTGGLAVDAFFVISGFLVTASVLKGDVVFYVVSRSLRIMPALWVCLALTAFVLGPIIAGGAYSWDAAWSYFWKPASLTSVEWFLPGVFTSSRNQAVNGSLWSILIEARMYVVLLVLYILGILGNRSVFNGLLFCAMIVAFFAPLQGQMFNTSPTDRHVMLLFMIGSFGWVNRAAIPITPLGVMVCLFALATAHGTGKLPLVYLATFPYLIFACAFGPKWPWPTKMGDYSYGVYLWGWPVQQSVLLFNPDMTVVQNQLFAIPIAVLAGALSWHVIEAPVLGFKGRGSRAIRRLSANWLPLRKQPSTKAGVSA